MKLRDLTRYLHDQVADGFAKAPGILGGSTPIRIDAPPFQDIVKLMTNSYSRFAKISAYQSPSHGRPRVEEIIAYFPALIPKSLIETKVDIVEA